MDYAHFYREIFDRFGYPLGRRTSLAESTIRQAAQSLDITLPAALRDFYAVAGREKRFNQCHNRIIAPRDWRVRKNRLIFMEENQWVVWWGVSVHNPDNNDPPVSQALNDDGEEFDWRQECRRCSEFISVMLHFQAISGGFEHYGNVRQPENLKRRLKDGWRCYGTVNNFTAFSRQNQVVCIEPDMGVAAAAKTRSDLAAIEEDLGLNLS